MSVSFYVCPSLSAHEPARSDRADTRVPVSPGVKLVKFELFRALQWPALGVSRRLFSLIM